MINYYNNDRYQWNLAKLSPTEFYKYVTTGEYPINIGKSKKIKSVLDKGYILKSKKTLIAQKLIGKLSIDEISKVTGLSKQEIQKF